MIVFNRISRVFLPIAVLCFFGCTNSPREEKNFFDGKSLDNWEASEMKYWRIEDSAIVGHTETETPQNDFLWSNVKVGDFYLDLEVKHDSTDRNAGIQFRSEKVNDYGQAKGYQADIGVNLGEKIWGTLYHEHGRGLLNGSTKGKDVVRDGEWNRYEILAVGHKIWIAINDQIVSATDDPGGELEGFIALQIHSGPPQTVRYRIRRLVHNPEIKLAGKDESELNKLLRAPLVPAKEQTLFSPDKKETIVFAGGTNVSNMQDDGYLETLITAAFPTSRFVFRNVAWDGDNVYEQFRDVGFGSFQENIDSINPTKIFIQFGQLESLEGPSKLDSFVKSYRSLLASLKKNNRKIYVMSPIPFEPEALQVNGKPHWSNPLDSLATVNYVNAIQSLAQEENCTYIDLFSSLSSPDRRITSNGIHLTEEGQQMVAGQIIKALGVETVYKPSLESLRNQIKYKNRIWFDYWRPGNWAFFKGDRQDPAFSRHWRNYSQRIFPEEIAKFAPLLSAAEETIESMQDRIEKNQPLDDLVQSVTAVVSETENKLVSPAEQEIAAFDIDPDYKVELFASEALGIAEPCAMRWDEKGRLWVLCIPAYPQPLPGQPANDRLVVLEDTDRNGAADKSTVFADNLNIPLGFELGHNGVYLGEQTRVIFLQDTNNDLKSDVRKTLLSGFGTHDSHQTINSFTWSPGGELFFSQGLSIHSSIETPWGIKTGHRGSIWRYRPVSGKLDLLVDRNIASENPWGITFGDWGELFSKSNDTGVYYSSPSLAVSDYRAIIPEIGATVIKSGIVEIPRSGHLPEDIRNDVLIAGYYNSKIERIKLRNDGAGFKGTLVAPLMSSRSNTFRPVDIKTGPDGAIYVLDWYNPIIGHYQASLRDPMRDKIHGRVWRITAKGRPLNKFEDISKLSVKEMIGQLASDEYWTRYQVRRAVAAKPVQEIIPVVEQWVSSLTRGDKNYDRNLLEAAALFASFEVVNERLLEQLSRAGEPGARAYAAELAGRWSGRLSDPLKVLKSLINDRHPRVRMMAVVGLGSVQLPESMIIASKISERPLDKFTRHAYHKTVHALKDVWEQAYRNNNIKFSNQAQLASVIGILQPRWVTSEMYRKLIENGNYPHQVTTDLYLGLLKSSATEDIEYVLQSKFASNNSAVLEKLAAGAKQHLPDDVAALLIKNLQSTNDPMVQRIYVRMIGSWQLKQHLATLHELTHRKFQDPGVVTEGIRVLTEMKYDDLAQALTSICTSSRPQQVRLACIAGFAKIDVKQSALRTIREIKSGTPPNNLRSAFVSVAMEPGGSEALAAEIERQKLNKDQATAALSVVIQNNIDHQGLIASIKKFAPDDGGPLPRTYDETFLARLAAEVKTTGNAAAGKKIFNELACSACHKIQGSGGDEGPNLSAIGSGLSMNDIITEVIWPNKNIKEGFFTIKVETKNGEVFQGIKALETEEIIAIKQSAAAKPREIRKADVKLVTEVGSSMPEGLLSMITNEERAHLIKFLSEQKN